MLDMVLAQSQVRGRTQERHTFPAVLRQIEYISSARALFFEICLENIFGGLRV